MITESLKSLNAALAGRLAFLNQGAGRPEIRVYGGARPASADHAPTTPLLVPIALQDPAGSVSDGLLTLVPYGPGTILASGTATWARCVNGDGEAAFDLDAGNEGSVNSECVLSKSTLTAGGQVTLLSAVLG